MAVMQAWGMLVALAILVGSQASQQERSIQHWSAECAMATLCILLFTTKYLSDIEHADVRMPALCTSSGPGCH